ncbi:sensor histidine kinase [Halobacterium wangiae]|uniref:sensor histidine kinase n=1 Tax=Halobacterium wangiae TaxID=2902623 RepID=UPI001E3D0435|nr:histidine kinase N-terminal 7TM domain-containing protein [Halobacterium wangiae]
MAFQATPYTLPLAASGLAFVAFSVYIVTQPGTRNRGDRVAVPLMAATGVWMLGYAAELSVTTTNAQLLFARVQYLGTVSVPLLWFAYILTYVGYDDLLTRRRWVVLATPPVVVFALALAYPASHLVWEGVETVDLGTFVALETDHGPVFYGFMAYVYALVAASVWLLVRHRSHAVDLYSRQTTALLVGALAPAITGVVYISGVNPIPSLNLPVLAFVVTAGVVAWSVARNELFTLTPVAWETVVRQLDRPVFVVDDDDRVVAANPAGRDVAAAPVGSLATDALTPVLGDDCWRKPGAYECEAVHAGEPRTYEVSVTSVDQAGARTGRVVLLQDVTERQVREERLEEFASVVSHDLRNPLNVARGHLELGRESGDDAHFETADDALDRMERIIDDLLTLAREGDADVDGEVMSLDAAARTAWDAVDTIDADATIDVQTDGSVVADETALLRLLENLFRNSVEHGTTSPDGTSADGSVTVTVGATDDGFFVADDGPGIPAEDRENVFERGYTTSENGTGFGLAIVQEVADAHGWGLSLTTATGEGTRFDVTVE